MVIKLLKKDCGILQQNRTMNGKEKFLEKIFQGIILTKMTLTFFMENMLLHL